LVAVLILAVGIYSEQWTKAPLLLVVALQFTFFITTARISPNASALALAPFSQNAGSASAVMGAVQSVVAMIGGIAIATFTNGTLVPLGIIMTVSMTMCVLIHWWMRPA
jgi:DHA1 family bicyclomycin/chloramphenicol resistance-like MFS transporter